MDLLDLWRGQLSLRRINVLIGSLLNQPGRSALAAAVDESAVWSDSEHLLAQVSDALELSNWLFYQANSSEDAEPLPAPTPMRRPGQEAAAVEPAQPTYASTEEVVDFFTRMNNL
ncbi:hypothetical protein [Streptomyces parvus]|uniref:Uncharacterized protein n=1 Tax=Streptomyces parvus TaxID=66428 RepID=A0A7K3S112_9ACTN|nr:hypothetical protein [Streptomyces parvus]NEC21177.1 hypothetical protein [Streptomyces parvus]NEE29823.1 hypothetical protein [Streptomyces sp. SID7982]